MKCKTTTITLVLRPKQTTKPAPKNKTARKLYQAMELAHTLSNE